MSEDSKPIKVKGKKVDDFVGITANLVSSINYKHMIFIFIAFLILYSDVFIMRGLAKIPGAVSSGTQVTMHGAVISGIMLCIAYLIGDVLIKTGVI
jgi:hypothetical protein